MRKKNGQISTEYLIVFGIAFLIIIAGVFAFMKFANSGALEQESCIIATGMHKCASHRVLTGTANTIAYVDIENMGDKMTISGTGTTFTIGEVTCTAANKIIEENVQDYLTFTCDGKLPVGSSYSTDFTVKYMPGDSQVNSILTGHMSGVVTES